MWFCCWHVWLVTDAAYLLKCAWSFFFPCWTQRACVYIRSVADSFFLVVTEQWLHPAPHQLLIGGSSLEKSATCNRSAQQSVSLFSPKICTKKNHVSAFICHCFLNVFFSVRNKIDYIHHQPPVALTLTLLLIALLFKLYFGYPES